MAIEAEALDHQALEMPDQIVGEIEAGRIGVGLLEKRLDAAIEGIAVRARDALDAFLLDHAVEQAAGAAVAVQHHDPLMAPAAGPDLGAHRVRDAGRRIVQLGRQAGHVHVRPAVQRDQGEDLAGERAAGDQQGARWRLRGAGGGRRRAHARRRRRGGQDGHGMGLRRTPARPSGCSGGSGCDALPPGSWRSRPRPPHRGSRHRRRPPRRTPR